MVTQAKQKKIHRTLGSPQSFVRTFRRILSACLEDAAGSVFTTRMRMIYLPLEF